MTEDEAKTKWCPFVRTTRENDNNFPVSNRGEIKTSAEINFKCIGSACMAWRWDYAWASSTEEGQGGDLVLRLKPLSGKPRMGWCGLAGKP